MNYDRLRELYRLNTEAYLDAEESGQHHPRVLAEVQLSRIIRAYGRGKGLTETQAEQELIDWITS